MSSAVRVRHRLVQAAVGGLTFAAILVYLWLRRGELVQLVEVPAHELALVAVLFTVGHWLNALEFWLLYRRLGTPLGANENWLLFVAGQLLNHLPGRVGSLYRLEYLRRVYGVTYARSASVYGIDLVVTVIVCSALGLLGSSFAGGLREGRSLPLLALFAALLVGAVAALFVPLPSAGGEGRVGRTWKSFRSGWLAITSAPAAAVPVAALEGVKYVVAAWRMQITFSWIGIEGKLSFFLVLAAVTGVIGFLAFTPAAMGLRELGIGGAAMLLGADLDQSLLGATVERAVLLVLTAVLGGIGVFFTMRRLSGRLSPAEPIAGPRD